MARPRADAGETPAKQRIIDAFFELLSEGGYSEVTARSLAACANVSPNTIYYHFENVFDVARCAVESELSSELALLLVSPEVPDVAPLVHLLDEPDNLSRFTRIRLVASSDNAQLVSLLVESVKNEWLHVVGIDESSLSAEQSQDLRFIFEGAIDLLASVAFGNNPGTLLSFFDRPLGKGIRKTLMNLMLDNRALS